MVCLVIFVLPDAGHNGGHGEDRKRLEIGEILYRSGCDGRLDLEHEQYR